MKRKMAILLCAGMVMSLLAGCGGNAGGNGSSDSKENKSEEASDKKSGEKVKLTFWKSPRWLRHVIDI